MKRTTANTRAPAKRRAPTSPFAALRSALDMSRGEFARLLGFSERSLSDWESGRQVPGEPALRLLRQMERVHRSASEVMEPGYVRQWFLAPSDAFGGLKPIELIERGEIDRVWRVLFAIESGTPI